MKNKLIYVLLVTIIVSITLPSTVYAAPPSNDMFANAKQFFDSPGTPTIPYTDTINVFEATQELGDPNVTTTCGSHPNVAAGLKSVWYKYSPIENTSILVDTFGSNYDTYIAVWTRVNNQFNLVACADDSEAVTQTLVGFSAFVGTTYYIQVAEFFSELGDSSLNSQSDVEAQADFDLVFNVKYYSDAKVFISDNLQGSYIIPTYALLSYPGTSGGPLFVDNINNNPIVSSMRLLYKNSKTETMSELMGVPNSQLSNDYWMPYYADDAIHDSQIRFTNTHDTLSTTVNVYLGDNPTAVASVPLGPQAAERVTLDNTTGGPLRIESTTAGVNILAGMRIIYKGNSSFDEIMALPTAQLDDEYWFPFYNHNNVNLFSQVRVGNPTNTDTVVSIYIGNMLMDNDYQLPAHGYFLQSYPGTSGGPLRVVSNDGTNIIASMRLLYKNSKTETMSELMGVPTSQLSNDYWMPVYIDDAIHDSQIRFTNTHATLSTTVNVYLGDNPTPVASIALGPQAADRVTLNNTTGGPLRIESTTAGVNILAGMRIIYKGNSSFDEIMALPTAVLDDEYWFPFYNHNNVNLFSQVRIGIPTMP